MTTLLLVAIVASTPAVAPFAPAADLAGDWVLVSQQYGEGSNNLVRLAPETIRLSFAHDGVQRRGRIHAGERFPGGLPWPSFVNDEGALPVEVVTLETGPDAVRAAYRVRPSPDSDAELVVEERYALSDGGRALVGTVTVEFVRGGRSNGSFVLHRRFERPAP